MTAFDGFTEDTCKILVAVCDDDGSGKIGYDEFKKLWSDLAIWKVGGIVSDRFNGF